MIETLYPENLGYDYIVEKAGQVCELIILDQVDSTNNWAKQEFKQGRQLPFACFAESQTHGKGRGDKAWLSPPRANIYMSLVISIKTPVEQAGMLSIVMGITIASVLEKAGVSDIKLKWPNDVLVNGKKIAGVLIETVKSEPDRTVVIIGIGLNYKWPSEALARPDQPWTDYVSCISNEALPAGRNEIAALLLKSCIESCTRYPEDHQSLLARYSDYDMCFHKDVDVIINNDLKYRGVAQGITDRGAIRVLIDGEERIFHSAQVSLRQTHVGDVKAC